MMCSIELRASKWRAPDDRRSGERTRFWFAKSDDNGGSPVRDARAADNTELRASEIARPTIGGAMSEHAFGLRRVTTTADLHCAMREQRTTPRRRKKLRRFSRSAEQSADNISDVLSCLRLATLAAKNTACITKMRHSLEAPLRVDRGVLATPAKRMPAT
jgi:hypothetical protein